MFNFLLLEVCSKVISVSIFNFSVFRESFWNLSHCYREFSSCIRVVIVSYSRVLIRICSNFLAENRELSPLSPLQEIPEHFRHNRYTSDSIGPHRDWSIRLTMVLRTKFRITNSHSVEVVTNNLFLLSDRFYRLTQIENHVKSRKPNDNSEKKGKNIWLLFYLATKTRGFSKF